MHLGRRPEHALLLLKQHGVQDGHDPVLKGTIIAVWDQHVAHSVQALSSQVLTPEVKVPCVGRGHTLQPHCAILACPLVVPR